MQYKVTQQYQRGIEQLAKTFTRESDARAYIQEHATVNASMKIQVTYRLYDFDDLLAEVDSSKLTSASTTSAGSDAPGSTGKGSGANFRPTPLPMAPRPSGMPQNWRSDKDDEDDKGK